MIIPKSRWSILASVLVMASLSACGGGEAGSSGGEIALSPDGCEPNGDLTTVTPGTLTVSVSNQLPYFDYEPGEALQGVEGNIVAQVAKDNCLKLEVIAPGEAGTVSAVQAGRSDLAASGSYVTPEREEIVDFSEPTWLDQAVFVSHDGVGTVEEARDLTVATVQGYGWEEQLEDVVGGVKLYQDGEGPYRDLLAGRIDVIMDASTTAPWFIQRIAEGEQGESLQVVPIEPYSGLDASQETNNYAFPYTKGNDSLGKALNATIDSMRRAGRIGELLAEFDIDPRNSDVEQMP